ncbi:hypothetical protein J7K44_03000 [bacterium]|nr:hypothetical protein [bacterium]
MASRKCPNCDYDVNPEEKWIVCPRCGYVIHFKVNKRGRVKKKICHSPSVLQKFYGKIKKEGF